VSEGQFSSRVPSGHPSKEQPRSTLLDPVVARNPLYPLHQTIGEWMPDVRCLGTLDSQLLIPTN
ncbi:hypothetical protein J6590_039152, partial [Homalodisca vitripennis]